LDKIREIQGNRNNKGKGGDSRFWTPEYGNHTIRFLPSKTDGELFFREFGEHWIADQNDGGKKKRIVCPRLTEKNGKKGKCPICTAGFELFNTGIKEDEDMAKTLMPSKYHYANVIVRGGGEDGEDVGPKIFKFGKKIGEKIVDECCDLEVDLSDPENGRDFRVAKKKVQSGTKTWPGYDNSKALDKDRSEPVDEDDLEDYLAEAEDVHALIEAEVKTYKEIEAEFHELLGGGSSDDYEEEPESEEEEEVEEEEFDESALLDKINTAVGKKKKAS
jgi:hypothetical protein